MKEHVVRLLGTIQSHRLETIDFIGPASVAQPSTWAMVDEMLCTLVDRLEEDGWKGKLRVVTHYPKIWPPGAFEDNLTRFRKKGEIVEIIDPF